jgi:hypothetical protein
MEHSSSHKSTVANSKVGLYTDKMDEINIPHALFKFLASKKEAPAPTGTVGKCMTMRERILQMSLFPDIYDKRAGLRHVANVDMGESHGY